MSRRRPALLFSTPNMPYPERSQRRSNSTESDDEQYVDRSLPASPSIAASPEPPQAGPSRVFQFAMEDEEVLRHARQAFAEEPEPVPEVKVENGGDDDELREIQEDDGDYANVGAGPAPPVHEVEDTEDEEEPPDERQCRICFSGQEEEAAMGRLISPCLCAGSMRYVHVQCINAWRGTGTNAKAFMGTPTTDSTLTSECPQCKHRYKLRRTLISGLASSRPILLLLSTLFFLGISILAGHILHRFLLTSPAPTSSRQKALLRAPKRSYQSSIFDIFHEDWDTFDNGVIIVGGGGTSLVWDVVMGSIQTFTDVANRLLVRQEGFFNDLGAPEWIGVIAFSMGIRFLLGLAVLGSLSFLSLLLSLSLFAPLNLVNGLRGTGLFNRRRGNNNGDGTAAGQLMIILFVLIGAANTLVKVYHITERITQRLLMYVETQILEVNPADRKRRNRRRKWYVTWWKEGRWARRDGWEEVRVRLWMGAREGLGPVWERMWTGRGEAHGMGIAG